jgi:hypothetical protein
MEFNQKSLMFRPQDFNGKYKLKNNPVGQWHRYERRHCNQHSWRVGGYLHYLADHAPLAVRKKWKTAFRKFLKLHPKF